MNRVRAFIKDEAGTARDEYFLLITLIAFTVVPLFDLLLLVAMNTVMAELQVVGNMLHAIPDLASSAVSITGDQPDIVSVGTIEIIPPLSGPL